MAYHQVTIYSYNSYNAKYREVSPNLPDAGYPDNDAYLAVRNAAIAGSFTKSTSPYYVGQDCDYDKAGDTYNYLTHRMTIHFRNTLNIKAGAPIEYALLEINKIDYAAELAATYVVTNGQPDYPHAPPVAADFDIAHYLGNGGQIVNPTGIGWKSILLNETGRSWIIFSGYSASYPNDYFLRVCLQSQDDIDGVSTGTHFNRPFIGISGAYNKQPRLTIRITVSIPTVETDEATNMNHTRCTLNGEITHNGYWLGAYGFEWKKGEDGEVISHQVGSSTSQLVSTFLYNTENDAFDSCTLYYYRAWCSNEAGKGYGEWKLFTTLCYAEVTTEPPTQVGIDHAKGNGTATGENITERGFEVKLAFSGTLREAINYSIAGFKGDFEYNLGTGKWEGTLVKTVTETGSFEEGAFIGDLGRFPIAVTSDTLFAGATYDYRAHAVIDGETYYGEWVEFTMATYPAGEGPDDVISPAEPIIEPIPEDELPEDELPEFEWPEIVFPPWEWPEFDIPPFEFDPSITFGRTFGAFLRGLDTKKDWKTLREKCIIYQENMNEFSLTVNHNSLVLRNLVNDIITYISGDVYPSDLKLVESSQQLTPLYLEEISPDGFKDIINDFRFKDVCNVHTLNANFQKILNSLNSLYESDYMKEPIYYNTTEYIDIQPTARRMILQLEDMRKKSGEITRLTIRNMKRIFTYV